MTTAETASVEEHASDGAASDPQSTPHFLVTIFLKGGASFRVHVSDWSVSRNRLTDDLASVSWEHVDDHPKLRYLDIDQIAAILVADTSKPVQR